MEMSYVEKSLPRTPSRNEVLEREAYALSRISRILCHSESIANTFDKVLEIMHQVSLSHGMILISNPEASDISLSAVHLENGNQSKPNNVRYKAGEGIVGRVLEQGNSVVIPKVSSDPSFQDKLSIYDYKLPFIGVPIENIQGKPIGVLAAQPVFRADELLSDFTRCMETIAHLIAQTVRSIQNKEKSEEIAQERDELRMTVREKYGFENMVIGHTASMRRVFDQARRVAKWDSTVLVLGESGTGKELISNAIHYNSPRAKQPYVRLNCAALPETLLESELFGHEKGSFTGAVRQHKGRFEQADGGTLFLDEIGEISPTFQAKLLRILQEGEFERIGGNQTIKVNIRIVAATHRNLEQAVENGSFREDLYYRLNVMTIQIPPLRDRRADLPELSNFLLGKLSKKQSRHISLTNNAVRVLMNHSWPGNVRELENCLERASIMSEDGCIDSDAISMTGLNHQVASHPSQIDVSPPDLADDNLSEREKVIAALERAGWVQAKAARLLNMTPRQIAYRIQTLNINVHRL
ncbi:MAG: nif-specific transcriptional activator NifA [Pseudomonadota bacterium]